MNTPAARIIMFLSVTICMVTAGIYAYTEDINYLLLPVCFIAAIYLLQNPELLFYVLIVFIPWSIEFHFKGGLSTDLPDEPLMLLSTLSIIIIIIYNRNKTGRKEIQPLVFIILLQLLWTVATVINSTDNIISVKYLLAKSWYLMAFLFFPLWLFRNKKVLRTSAIVLLISMLTFMFVALTRQIFNEMRFDLVNDSLRPFFHNHVNYSALLVFMVPIEIAVIRLAGTARLRIFMSCMVAITIVALYFSYSRGAWLAFGSGLLAYWLIKKQFLLTAFFGFMLICIGSVAWLKHNNNYLKFSPDYNTTIFHEDFQEHLVATYKMKDLSTAERFYRWVAGTRMIEDYWQTGSGPGSFYNEYKPYTVPAFKTWVSANKEHTTVHNYFLLLLLQ